MSNGKPHKPGMTPPQGMHKGLTNYGDLDFSVFLRRAFIKGRSMPGRALGWSAQSDCHSRMPCQSWTT